MSLPGLVSSKRFGLFGTGIFSTRKTFLWTTRCKHPLSWTAIFRVLKGIPTVPTISRGREPQGLLPEDVVQGSGFYVRLCEIENSLGITKTRVKPRLGTPFHGVLLFFHYAHRISDRKTEGFASRGGPQDTSAYVVYHETSYDTFPLCAESEPVSK